MNAEFGKARFRKSSDESVEVYVQFATEQSLIFETYLDEVEAATFPYYTVDQVSIPLTGKWKISFIIGGPELPAAVETDSLRSWTNFGVKDYPALSLTLPKSNSQRSAGLVGILKDKV